MNLTIGEDFAGLTVKKLLLNRLHFSRAAVTALKGKEKGILVNGEHRTVRYVLKEGDRLSLMTQDVAPSPRIRPSQGEINVIYEDEDLIALNKPANMAVHPSKKLQDDTLAGRLMYHRYPMVFRAAGRLDKDTSGVVISAKSQVIAARFFDLIRNHGIKKEYLVLTESEKLPPQEGEINLCIRRDPESYITRVCFPPDGTEKDSERALTRFLLLKSAPPYHLFLASPITGRTHQLRAHFSALGFPLAGDTLYGKESRIIPRQALHALRLSFPHPATGEPLSLFAPIPQDLTEAMQAAFGEIPPIPKASPDFFSDARKNTSLEKKDQKGQNG